MNLKLSDLEFNLPEEKVDALIGDELFLLCTELCYSKDAVMRDKYYDAAKTMYEYYTGRQYNG